MLAALQPGVGSPLDPPPLWQLAQPCERWGNAGACILALPSEPLVRRRPYGYLRHPYLAIVVGLLAAPLMFGAWRTAIAIGALDLVAIGIRIHAEDAALGG